MASLRTSLCASARSVARSAVPRPSAQAGRGYNADVQSGGATRRELAEQAAQEPYEHRRRHLLHLAATHQRAADKNGAATLTPGRENLTTTATDDARAGCKFSHQRKGREIAHRNRASTAITSAIRLLTPSASAPSCAYSIVSWISDTVFALGKLRHFKVRA